MKKKIILCLVLLGAVLGFMILGAVTKAEPPDETQAGSATPSQIPTQVVSAPVDPNLPAPVPQDQQETINGTVQGFILARSGQRWDDASATSWVDRATQFTTDQYSRQLRQTYPDDSAGSAWQQLVQERLIREARIDSLEIVQSQNLSKGSATVLARYRISLAKDGQAPQSFEPFTKLVTVNRSEGQWRVAGVGDVAAGSIPEWQRPAKAPSNPPTVSD